MTPTDLRAMADRGIGDPFIRNTYESSYLTISTLSAILRLLADHLEAPTVAIPHEGTVT